MIKQKELELQKSQEKIKSDIISKKELAQEFMCSICQEMLFDATMLQCSHTFCRDCVSSWLKENKVNLQ